MRKESRLLTMREEMYVLCSLFLILMGYIYICLIFRSYVPYILGFTFSGIIICYLLIKGSNVRDRRDRNDELR